MHHRPLRTAALAAAAVAATAALLAGCSAEASAERDGRDLGRALCALADAPDEAAAQQARDDVSSSFDALRDDLGSNVEGDLEGIDDDLSSLLQAVVSGDQDQREAAVADIDRKVGGAADTTTGVAQAGWDGVSEGLADCL